MDVTDKVLCRVAILGASGFVGRNVREELQRCDDIICNLSRQTGFDLLNLEEASRALVDFQPDYILNCAAMSGSIFMASHQRAEMFDVNMRMALNLYRIAQELPAATIINPIANCAYPGELDLYDETMMWSGPMHDSVISYGSTRRMLLVLSDCYQKQYGVKSINLIVPNMYGPGDSVDPRKAHALNALITKFLLARDNGQDQVDVWGTGKPVREWLYVKDFARVVRLITNGRMQIHSAVNVAQKKGFSIRELAELVRTLTGYGGDIRYDETYPDGAPKKIMNDVLFRCHFPIFEFTAISDGVWRTIEFYARLKDSDYEIDS